MWSCASSLSQSLSIKCFSLCKGPTYFLRVFFFQLVGGLSLGGLVLRLCTLAKVLSTTDSLSYSPFLENVGSIITCCSTVGDLFEDLVLRPKMHQGPGKKSSKSEQQTMKAFKCILVSPTVIKWSFGHKWSLAVQVHIF